MINATSCRLKMTISFLVLIQIAFIFTTSAQTVMQRVIGNASGLSSFAYGPIYRNQGNSGLLNFSRHAYLYTAAELNIPAGSKIISLEWMKKDTGRVLGNNTFNIWLSNTNATTFPTAATWNTLTNGVEKVFGSTTFSITGGANTYQLATFNQASPNDSFTYSGGNLQILVDWAKQGNATAAITFYYLGATGRALGTASTTAMSGNTTLTAATYGNNRPTLRITYVTVPSCSGTPAPGNTICNVNKACPGTNFVLGMQNATPGSQVTFQWQSADDVGFTVNVNSLGTGSTVTTTQSSSKYYRCLVTCGASGQSAASNPLLLPMSPVYECFCPSTAVSTSDEEIFKVVFGNYKNCSNCNTTAPGPSSSAGVYSNYQTTPPIPMKKGIPIPFLVEVGLCNPSSYPNRTAIFMDLNRNGVLTDSGEIVYSSPTSMNGAHTESGFIVIPDSIANGTLGMRIITIEQNTAITNPCAVYSWGETEDYVVDVQSTSFCSGTPNPGATQIDFPGSCSAVTGSYEICKGNSVTLSLSNTPTENGVTYQWYNSAGIIVGATGITYTTPAIVAPMSYYCAVTCTSGSNQFTANSTPITITLKSFLGCYCGSSAANTSDEDIFTFGIGSGSNTSFCTIPATGPGSMLNMYSNFTNLGSLASVVAGTSVPFTIDVNDCDVPPAPYYSFGASLWIDFNQNGSFNDAGEQVFLEANAILGPRTITGTIAIPCTALSGTTMLRIIAAESLSGASLTPCLYYGFGETEDYLITILPKAENVGFNFGTAAASSSSPSSGVPVNNVSVSNLSQGNNANTGQTTLFMASATPSNYSGASGGSYAGITARNRSLQLTDSSAYYQLTLTPGTGYQVLLDSIRLGSFSSTTGPTTIDIRTSANNYASSIGTFTVAPNATWTFNNPAISRVLSNGPLTIRIYGYVPGGPGSVTTGNTTANWLIDDLNLKFGVRCIPPCSLTLNAYNTPIACFGGTSSINAYASGSIEPVSYKLNNGPWQSSNVFAGLTIGTYTVSAQDANSCTASTIVVITQPGPVSSNTSLTVCNTYSWPVNNQTYTASGVYFSSGFTTAGCPRNDTLNLTVNYSSSSAPVSATACNSYLWNGVTYTASGTYTFTSLNTSGCVHTQTLNLTVLSSNTSQTVSACDSYTWPVNNVTYTVSGTYSFTLGCSVNTLNLTITPSTSSSNSISACNSYTWPVNGTTYTASGTYTAINGCQTSILVLTIIPNTSSSTTATACDSYTWTVNNTTYSASGTYTNVTGCHTATLILTITPSTTNNASASACDSYVWNVNNVTYTASGNYTVVTGCQTNNLNLIITPSTTSTTSASACSGYTWTVNNVTYTASGTYTHVSGCQTSILQLTITPSTSSSSTVSACNSYTWPVNNVTYTASGTYTNINVCQTSTLNLTITPSTSSTTNATACNSYLWTVNNTTYTASGTYTNVSGCNTSILNLTIIASTSSSSTVSACNNYTWPVNNVTYTSSGTYTNVNGCHTSTLVLTITPSTTSNTSASACNSYLWTVNNVTYTASGNYSVLIGCQTNNLNLTITPSTTSTTSASACSSYTWTVNNVTYTASGTYTHVLGCHTSTLQLTITPSTSSSSTASACNSYTWPVNNVTYTASGTYTNITVCHTSTLNLTITPSTSSTTNASACNSYTWTVNNTTYTASGTYTNVNGCNTSILNLTITPSTSSTASVSACNSYTWSVNNVTYTASGNFSNVSGCHTSNLNLTITPSTTGTTIISACDSYTWNLNNVTYTNSGTYTFVTGCQTNILNLTITASSSSTTSATACGSYTWNLNNVTYTASGSYIHVIGCQTNTLNVIITPGSSSSQSVTACSSYTWSQNNVTYTTSGTYNYAVGCQLYTLQLTIIPGSFNNQAISACDAFTWSVNNVTYTASGVYTFVNACQTQQLTLTITTSTASSSSATACGSYAWPVNNVTYTASGTYTHVLGCHTSTLQLQITPVTVSNATITACDSYTWPVNNTTYTASGSYSVQSGCHTSNLILTIQASSTSTTNVSACNSYTWPVNNVTYTASGTYTVVSGCQTSILVLTVQPSSTSSNAVTACDTYFWTVSGLNYTSSGTFTSITGCLTSILQLTIVPSTTSSATVTACDSYTWAVNNVNYTSSGTYTVVNGCATNILNLSVTASTSSTASASACGSYTWPLNGVTYTQSGTYTKVTGCHTTTLQLTITPNSSSSTSVTACGSYTWPVNNVNYTTSGTYTVINGCNTSILVLAITPITSSTQTISACGTYTWPVNNVTYTTSGNYVQQAGCHTNNLVLTITPSSTTNTSVTACNSYTWTVNNITYTSSGIYTVVNACVTSILNLTINAGGTSTTTITACNTYNWPINGQTYTTSGTYTQQVGCNTQILQLSILPGSSSSTSVSACNSYIWSVNGITYTTSGTYTSTSGCNTNVLNLTIQSQTSSISNIVASVSYTWPVNGNTYTQSGTYTSTSLNAAGCLHVSTLVLQISTPLSLTLTENQPISCHGNNDGSAIASAIGDQPFTFRLDGGAFNNTSGLFYNLTPGTHTICVKDVHGAIVCQTITFMDPDPIFMTFNIDSVVSCQGNDGAISAYISGGTNLLQGYLTWWINSAGDTVNDIFTNNFALNLTGLAADSYTVAVEDDNGCFYAADTILVTSTLSVSASNTPILCPGGTSVITPVGIGGVPYDTLTYLINGLPLLPAYPAGTYTVTAIDVKNCTATTVITINNPGPGWTQSLTACDSYLWPATGIVYTTSGAYTTTLSGSAGCDSVITLNLQVKYGSSSLSSASACESYFWPLTNATYTMSGLYTASFTNSQGCDSVISLDLNIQSCASVLNLTLFLQGYYAGSSTMNPALFNQGVNMDPTVTDSIDVSLYADQSPYPLVATVRVLLSTTGHATCVFPPLSGSYYIGVRGRNALNTWSTNPVQLGSGSVSYDFSSAATQAYGGNQFEVENGVWAIYSGDINADDNIDIADISIIETEVSNFAFGYNASDTNGDGNVDILDVPVVDLNVNNFIYAMYP